MSVFAPASVTPYSMSTVFGRSSGARSVLSGVRTGSSPLCGGGAGDVVESECALERALGLRTDRVGDGSPVAVEHHERDTADAGEIGEMRLLALRDVEGLSTAEAAEVLGIGERALKSRVHRGRMALRAKLDDYFREGYA